MYKRQVRTAVKAVGKAREERDEYRRVLAASIATDRQREARVEALKEERLRLEGIALSEGKIASEVEGRRRELNGRVEHLELRLANELAARERVLGDAADRAWAEREAARSDMVRIIAAHRSEVSGALEAARAELAEIRRAAPLKRQEPTLHPLRRVRAGALIGLSLVATLAALALIPPTVVSISDPERALFVHLASGLGPWQLILSVVLFCGAAVGLLSWALRDLERMGQTSSTGAVGDSPDPRVDTKNAPMEPLRPPSDPGATLRNVELTPVANPSIRDGLLARNGRSG